MQRRRLLLAGSLWAALPGWAADLPALIAATRWSVLPIGLFDPLGSPRFSFRGTAFAVGDGSLVVTNHHVIDTAASASTATGGRPPPGWVLQQPLPGGGQTWRRLQIVARDPTHDLVLLRLEGEPLPPLKIAPDERLREGQAVLLMGFPIAGALGFQPVTHRGMVSSIAPIVLPAANAGRLDERAIAAMRRGPFDIVQLDATAYPGNSGGPVVDAETGEVLAVVNMVLTKGGREGALQYPSGISYAIPGRWVRELMAVARR
jgi:S1-C subfamily serine protease